MTDNVVTRPSPVFPDSLRADGRARDLYSTEMSQVRADNGGMFEGSSAPRNSNTYEGSTPLYKVEPIMRNLNNGVRAQYSEADGKKSEKYPPYISNTDIKASIAKNAPPPFCFHV